MVRCYTDASRRWRELIRQEFQRALGHLRPRHIVLKPNWVVHESDPAFPIDALVTDSRVIEAAAEACWELFPQAESILVGDCPLQYADWPVLRRQSGLDPVIDRLTKKSSGKIVFRDLRRDVFAQGADRFLEGSTGDHGDPRGYREIELGPASHLEPISKSAAGFAVNDYSSAVTQSNHRRGSHRYLVSQSILDADLLINLPKWKAHQKSAVTGALKNLVGVNGDKAYLPHFRKGAPKWGGDEYRDENRWLYFAQTTLREKLQKRSRWAFRLLKPGWELIKRARGIETKLVDPRATPKSFYIAGGSWHGNDTIWRMIYDLNYLVQMADASGRLGPAPARQYYCLVDGLISGEGNGPLQPIPKKTDWLLFGADPFAIDTVLAWTMGFDPVKIPILQQRGQYLGPDWGKFDLRSLAVELDGKKTNLMDLAENFRFAPPPGWRNYVER